MGALRDDGNEPSSSIESRDRLLGFQAGLRCAAFVSQSSNKCQTSPTPVTLCHLSVLLFVEFLF
jgi:hypothetical protein